MQPPPQYIGTRPRSYLLLWLMAAFGLLGNVLATWLAPKFIAWYFNPPAQVGFSCVEPIQWALSRFRAAQFWGLGLGVLLGVVVYFLVRRRNRRNGNYVAA